MTDLSERFEKFHARAIRDGLMHGNTGVGSRDAELLDEALAAIRALDAVLSKLAAVRPRTLGIDGAPKEWPVVILETNRVFLSVATGMKLGGAFSRSWEYGKQCCVEAVDTDRYIPLRALLELDHD
jgi:hypothetical protein